MSMARGSPRFKHGEGRLGDWGKSPWHVARDVANLFWASCRREYSGKGFLKMGFDGTSFWLAKEQEGNQPWGAHDLANHPCPKNKAFYRVIIWLWLKKPVPKWNPGKWKHGPKPASPLLFNFEPHQCRIQPKHGQTRRHWGRSGTWKRSED